VRSLFKRPSPTIAVPSSQAALSGSGSGSVEKIGSKVSESSCGSGAHNSSSQNLSSINGGLSNGGVSGSGSPSLSSSARRCSPRKLVTKRRWSDLLAVLNLPRRRQYVVTWEDSFSGHLFLHEVVSYDPPAEVVSRLIELYPPALCHRSISGCLPLHCAVMYGASPEVVRVLVEATDDEETVAEALSGAEDYGTDSVDFSAPSVGDSEGRTPLHLAVRKAVKAHEEPMEVRRERNRMNGANKLKRGRSTDSATADEEEEKRRALAVMEVVSAVTPLDVFYRRRDFGPKRETPVQAAESCEAVSAALLKAIQKRTAEDEEHQKSRSSIQAPLQASTPSSTNKLNSTNKHNKANQYKAEERRDRLEDEDVDSVTTAEDTEDEKEGEEAKAAKIRELMIWSRRQSTRNLKTSRSRMPPTLQPPAA